MTKAKKPAKRTKAEEADLEVAKAVAPVRNSPAVRALGFASELADQPPLISICAATLAAGLVMKSRRVARAGARMLAAELLATTLKSVVKHRIDRTRPSVVADGGRYQRRAGSDPTGEMSSFPSGHTAGAVAVARALAREYPEHQAAAYVAAAAIGANKIPRCKHYPSDIAAGALVGLAAEAMVAFAESVVRSLGTQASADEPLAIETVESERPSEARMA